VMATNWKSSISLAAVQLIGNSAAGTETHN